MDPEHIQSNLITCNSDLSNLKEIYNQYNVVVVPLDTISLSQKTIEIEATKFYDNFNSFSKKMVSEPSIEEKFVPRLYKSRKAPDDSSGFIHQYNTPIHNILHNNDKLIEAFNIMNPEYSPMKFAPNRLRICRKTCYDANSLHIEGKDILVDENGTVVLKKDEMACIVGLTGNRRFVFWDMTGADLTLLKDYWEKKGKKDFTKINPIWMNNIYPNRRRVIEIDCNNHPMLIMWSESTPHEIASMPSLSAYISPILQYNNSMINNVTSFQPLEYRGLTEHESDLIGMCYNMPGSRWPSNKKAYSYCHVQSYFRWKPDLKDYFIENDKIRIKLPIHGKINQKSQNYRKQLRKRKIKLNNIVFSETMPLFVVDILKMTDKELKMYGFIEY